MKFILHTPEEKENQPEKAKKWGQQGTQQPFHVLGAKLQDVAE